MSIILLFISSLIEVCLVIYFSPSVVLNELNNARRLLHYLTLFSFQAAHVLCTWVHVCVYECQRLCVCVYFNSSAGEERMCSLSSCPSLVPLTVIGAILIAALWLVDGSTMMLH